VRAIEAVRRCLRLFSPAQRDLLGHVVLLNLPLARWRVMRGLSHAEALTLLVAVLDILVLHFQTEIARYGVAV
jgi:hypothetical protein